MEAASPQGQKPCPVQLYLRTRNSLPLGAHGNIASVSIGIENKRDTVVPLYYPHHNLGEVGDEEKNRYRGN